MLESPQQVPEEKCPLVTEALMKGKNFTINCVMDNDKPDIFLNRKILKCSIMLKINVSNIMQLKEKH